MGALEAGVAGFAGADAAGFCPGVWAEARLATSNRLHRNRMLVKLDARMRKAPQKIPRKYCTKRRYGRARRMGMPYSQCKERDIEGAGGAWRGILLTWRRKSET